MGNLFSEEQMLFFYKDQAFITFLSDYFTSFEIINQNTDMDTDDDNLDNINVYARILLANINDFYGLLSSLGTRVSFSHNKVIQSRQGEIRGVLLINQYAKEIVSQHFPRKYDCIQKKKTYCTPENVLIYFSLFKIREIMERFLISINSSHSTTKKSFRSSTEYAKILECIGICEDLLSSKIFVECQSSALKYINIYGSTLPTELIEIVEKRLRGEKIINISIYRQIIEWIEKFLKQGVTFLTPNTLDIIRYDDTFADILFELWTLHSLKNTIATACSFNDIKYYKFNRSDGVIFECIHNQEHIEFIYQKGIGVYWNDEVPVSWEYYSPQPQKLVGKPDISIRITGNKNRLIMFDAKNRIRNNGHISEEIYKMIGYFDNFKKMFESPQYQGTPKECILLFRGDKTPFIKELKKRNSDYYIRAVSVSPTINEAMNEAQFKYIADIVASIINC